MGINIKFSYFIGAILVLCVTILTGFVTTFIKFDIQDRPLLILPIIVLIILISVWNQILAKSSTKTRSRVDQQIVEKNMVKEEFPITPKSKYLKKPKKWLKIIFALPSRLHFLIRCLKKVFIIPMIIISVAWLGLSYYFDFEWDDPGIYSQVVPLSSPLGIPKDKLTLQWHHFGRVHMKQTTPQTILMSIGYENKMIPILSFEQKYFVIKPDTLPRNNLRMVIRPVHSNMTIRDTFEKLVTDKNGLKISSTVWSPAVYSIQIEAKSSESEHSFLRRFNFRTRSLPERFVYYLFCGAFVAFAFFLINGPNIVRALRHNSYISAILKKIGRYLIKLLENAMCLGEPMSKHIQLIEVTLYAVIKIDKNLLSDDYADPMNHLKKQADDIVQRLRIIADLRREFESIKISIESFLQYVEDFYFNRLIDAPTKKDFDIVVVAIINARFEMNNQAKQLELITDEQDATLEKRRTSINKKISELKVDHERGIKKRKKEIEDQIVCQLPIVLKDIGKSRYPGTTVNEVFGAKKFRIDLKIPDTNKINVVLKRGNIKIASEPKEQILKEEAIISEMIPIQKIEDKMVIEKDQIVYNIILKELRVSKNEVPEVEISLLPKSSEDEAKLSNFYRELLLEDIKNSNLAKISEDELIVISVEN